jgi:DNA polymerase III delta prime subunit
MKRKPPFITLALIVLSVLIVATSGPIGSAIELPSPLKPFAFLLFLGLTILLSLIAVAQYFLQQEKPASPASSLNQQNRQILLKRVRSYWITGVLDQSLHGAALIALGLQNQPDVLADPWRLVIQEKDQSSSALPMGTTITQVYDKALGELLILGEPGCGKTTLLLELTRDLLDRAEQDEGHLMPLVFSLSSWAVKRQPLTDWLVEEMNIKYQVPRRLAQAWVGADQVLPLLDGLDEIAAPHQVACVECINTFRQEHGLVPVVVCSRSDDYLALKPRLLLDSAVVVQPLTQQQIDEYLSNAGSQLEGVRVALNDDLALREMATTPLLLSILTLAYRGRSVKELVAKESLEMRRRQLFDDYVAAMLQRRSSETRYATQQTISWLMWLARQMMEYDQTELYLERLQPVWLPDRRSRVVYHSAVTLLDGLLHGLFFGLFAGLFFGLFAGLFFGLFAGLFFGLIAGVSRTITPVEVLAWSKQGIKRGILVGLLFGLAGGLFFGLLGGLLVGLLVGLFLGLFGGLLGVLVLGPLFGLSREMLDTDKLDRPNRGIWLSARFAVTSLLLVGLVGGLLFGLVGGLLHGLVGGLLHGLVGGLLFGLLSGMIFGGDAVIEHAILRWLLWRAGLAPWNYSRFLDYATKCIFLRKVGGGYTFVHRLLLEYFATRADLPAYPYRK